MKLRTFKDAEGVDRIIGEGQDPAEVGFVGYRENTPNKVDAAANADVADAADQAEARNVETRRRVLGGSVGGARESSSSDSGNGRETVDAIKARISSASDDELAELEKDDRKGVQEAAAAERARRDED